MKTKPRKEYGVKSGLKQPLGRPQVHHNSLHAFRNNSGKQRVDRAKNTPRDRSQFIVVESNFFFNLSAFKLN